MKQYTLALNGFDRRNLISVESMRQNYERALNDTFQTLYSKTFKNFEQKNLFDAVLTYYDPLFWKQTIHPNIPLIFPIHGDAISRQEFLYKHLKYLDSGDLLIVNCNSDIKILHQMLNGPRPSIACLHFPIDTGIFKKQDRDYCLDKLSIESADLVIGFVGRLIPQKNLHQFLRMIAVLKKRLSPKNIVGIIAGKYCKPYPVLDFGTKTYSNFIKNLQKKLGLDQNIYYMGELSPLQLSYCYGAMDILIHPTNNLEEAFGLVPVEAMACGVPIIGASYGGLKDTIISGQTGFLMPTWVTSTGIRMDTIYGTNAAFLLLQDKTLREKMSEACINRVKNLYTYEVFANSLRSIITGVIEQRQNKRIQSLVPSELPSPEQTDRYLPILQKPWEEYLTAVSYYVSSDLPELKSNSKLQLSSPIYEDDNHIYHLDDPAWPGYFSLQDHDLKILNLCHQELSISQLMKFLPVKFEQIEKLIKLGLLICSNSTTLN
ncbi:MAG: glycosyltransferase family 4 protein [Chitinophagaceae bacterium]